MDLFQLGDFTLSSGAKSGFKFECDAWTDGDVECLAAMIRDMVRPFASVEGVPSGGLRLAKALSKFTSLSGPHLIVDDVLTTGGSMCKTFKDRISDGHNREVPGEIIGAVVFARGQCPIWVDAVFQMHERLWVKSRQR